MSTWREYDPFTGLQETNKADDEGLVTVHKQQDVEALLDRNAEIRATGAADAGIKKGLWHYASVPLAVQYELLTKYGLNIHNKSHTDRIFDVINRDYPALKVTQKHHSRRHKGSLSQVRVTAPGKLLTAT
jgi:hypothetical protein